MIKFLLKLWDLNRPYKGRFLLGVFFGMLNGMGQIAVLGTVLFVIAVIFGPTALNGVHFPKPPSWIPASTLAMFHQLYDWLSAHAVASAAWRIAVLGLIPLVVLLRGVVAYLNSYLLDGWRRERRAICGSNFSSTC